MSTVADVDRHQLAVEVEDALPFGGEEPDALGVVDDDRVERALDRPGKEGVRAVEGADPLARHRPGSRADAHGSSSAPSPCGHTGARPDYSTSAPSRRQDASDGRPLGRKGENGAGRG